MFNGLWKTWLTQRGCHAYLLSAHWFPDQWWEEAFRVLKPGGTVAVWTVSHQMMIG
jgi:ubiquinone/menaquinone biosynthesis C-methylase UbiE